MRTFALLSLVALATIIPVPVRSALSKCTGNPPMYNGLPCASTTRYWDGQKGACGCGSSDTNPFSWQWTRYTAAASQPVFDNFNGQGATWCGAGCGACYELTPTGDCPFGGTCAGNTNPITIMVSNRCPYIGNEAWCTNPGVANSVGLFAHFDIMDYNMAGIVSALQWNNPVVTYRRVACGNENSPTCDQAGQCQCNMNQCSQGATTPGSSSSSSSSSSSAASSSSSSAAAATTSTTGSASNNAGGGGSSTPSKPSSTSTTGTATTTCNTATTFPADMTGRQCQGLSRAWGPTSADDCAKAACSAGSGVWQWCQPGYSCSPASSCWIGSNNNCAKTADSNSGWLSKAINDPSASQSSSSSSSSGSATSGSSTQPSGGSSSTSGTSNSNSNSNSGSSTTAGCSASISTVLSDSWSGGGRVAITVTNTGTKPITALTLNVPGAGSNSWNLQQVSGDTYTMPSWVFQGFNAGTSNNAAGYTYSGAQPAAGSIASITC